MLPWLHYQLEVKDFIGRDVKPGTIGAMATQLETWCNSCGVMMNTMECEMNRANKVKEQRLAEHRRLEEEVSMYYRIMGIIHGRKILRISQIWKHSRMFSCTFYLRRNFYI